MLIWETRDLTAEMYLTFSEWRLVSTPKKCTFYFFSPGLGNWQYYNFFYVVDQSGQCVQRPTQIQEEEAQTLHCFLQSVTSHYQPAGHSKCGRGTGAWEYLHVQLGPQAFTVQDLE